MDLERVGQTSRDIRYCRFLSDRGIITAFEMLVSMLLLSVPNNNSRFPFSADEDLELKEFGLKVYVEYCFSVNLYLCRNIPRIVPGWKKRHMHLVGMPLVMQYRATEIQSIPGPRESLKWLFVPEDGEVPVELDVYNFKGPGRALAIFKDIFHEVYEKTWKQKFEENSIRNLCSLGLMTSVLLSSEGKTLEAEAARRDCNPAIPVVSKGNRKPAQIVLLQYLQ
ncbi:hypothetical protein NC651_000002 [Populus alba x Populus x berolinensis]|nr:hypothetical protein NC651_000002 [Populus alba x Populus x berolinensis]